VAAQQRGATFYRNGYGWYYPTQASEQLAHQAVRDVAAAMGLSVEEYLRRLPEEGPDMLKRLPGVG
jgi:uncharacterized protein YidB (DUF937 family)